MPDLCKLDDVKDWLELAANNTAPDKRLARLIAAVSADFLREIDRSDFYPARDYVDVFDGADPRRHRYLQDNLQHARRQLVLSHRPINSVASVTIDGTDVPASDGATDGYWFDRDDDSESRTTLRIIGNSIPIRTRAQIIVRYNAGYTEVPADVEQAVIDWVAYRYRGKEFIGQTSKNLGDGQTVNFQQVYAPETTKSVILRYSQQISLL
jgi:hypothetical protein